MKVNIAREGVKREEIIELLLKKKATNTEEIPEELLQYMENKGIDLMARIINDCYNTALLL